MFTVVITEKGGDQRRLTFTEPEVTIGRVPGNDVVLPKGNVSKRHSRIVLKDNRFIVVDLKSTNGTYVNGRKITSPLVVKEGDKIYVGDYILTLEGDPAAQAPEAMKQPSMLPGPLTSDSARPKGSPLTTSAAPPLPSRAPDPLADDQIPAVLRTAAPSTAPSIAPSSNGSHSANTAVGMAAPSIPPVIAISEADRSAPYEHTNVAPYVGDEPTTSEPVPVPVPVPAHVQPIPPPPDVAIARSMPPVLAAPRSSLPPGLRDDLRSLMARMGREFDIENAEAGALSDEKRWQKAEKVVQGKIVELTGDGGLPRNVDKQALGRAALHEAVGLGALDALLSDAEIFHIVVERFDRVRVDRGAGLTLAQAAFSSPQALLTVVRRLCAQAGVPEAKSASYDLALPNGLHLVAVLPAAASDGPVLSLRRRPTQLSSLTELKKDALIDAVQAKAISDALRDKKHVWVVGPSNTDLAGMMSSILDSCEAEQRVALVERAPEIALGNRFALCLKLGVVELAELIDRVRYFKPDRLVIHELREADLSAALHAFAHRRDGSLASLECGSGREALSVLEKVGSRELVQRAVGLVVELSRDSSGHTRVAAVHQLEANGTGSLALKSN